MLMDSYESTVLSVTVAADLARKRLDRGVKLNATEARAIIMSTSIESARAGETLATVRDQAKKIIGRDKVLDHAEKLLHTIRIYAQFPDGRYLIIVRDPIS
ncbi:urease subunit gamma [Stenotrophomonas sp. SORGH_AS321]|nr:urease subunit gamma [Stenotrophomonas sp. SORGH_AS_0321]